MSRFDKRDSWKFVEDEPDGKQGYYHKALDPAMEAELQISERRRPVCLDCGRYISGETQVCRRCEQENMGGGF
jgi:hypothetical protein